MNGANGEMKIMKIWPLERPHSKLDLQLPWLAMGYTFSWQASLTFFSPYFLLFGQDLKLLVSIWHDVMIVINFNDPLVWIQACEQWTILFMRAMPMAMENLVIAYHWNTFWYATSRRRGYQLWVRRFKLRDYVYLQQTSPTTLDVTVGCVILHVWKVLPFKVCLLEGWNG